MPDVTRRAHERVAPVTENQIQPQMVTALGALELDGSDTGQLYASRVLPSETIFQFIELAQLSGLIAECSESRCPHPVVLDLLDGSGDIVGDRCVVSREAWAALNSELALRPVSS